MIKINLVYSRKILLGILLIYEKKKLSIRFHRQKADVCPTYNIFHTINIKLFRS